MRLQLLRSNPELSFRQKLWHVSWPLVLLICVLAGVGFVMLYSAANGSMDPWASRQMVRFAMGLVLMMAVALTDIRLWFRWAYGLYFGALALLVAVEIMGVVGMGAQRWINLGIIQLQPSEVMKVAIVLALARYFHSLAPEEVAQPLRLIGPALIIAAPVALVMKQPDLGTAVMLAVVGATLFFLAGVRLWVFGVIAALGGAAVPIAWGMLHDYQKRRVWTFLDPSTDPLGAGYHITQSKIALGSGGVFGKGFLEGTQSHLNFLPEKQTDFIFTMLAEEFGLVGSLALLATFGLTFVYGWAIAVRARCQFARLLALGLTFNLFLYVFINAGMVMGLMPVVGVPMPLISYGGTAMLTVMIAFGLIISVSIHRDIRIPRRGMGEG